MFAVLCAPAFGQTTTEDWFNKGVALGNQGNYDDAIKAFDEAIKLGSDHAEIYNNKGNALIIVFNSTFLT